MRFAAVAICFPAGLVLGYIADEVSPVSIGGNAGWVGAGLLGAVLAWLMLRHLPAKDAQLLEKDAAHERHVQQIVDSFVEADRIRRADQITILDSYRAEQKAMLSVLTELSERLSHPKGE